VTSQPQPEPALADQLTELIESLPLPWLPGMTIVTIDFFPP
jgi:hypothetical protein